MEIVGKLPAAFLTARLQVCNLEILAIYPAAAAISGRADNGYWGHADAGVTSVRRYRNGCKRRRAWVHAHGGVHRCADVHAHVDRSRRLARQCLLQALGGNMDVAAGLIRVATKCDEQSGAGHPRDFELRMCPQVGGPCPQLCPQKLRIPAHFNGRPRTKPRRRSLGKRKSPEILGLLRALIWCRLSESN